ncbi:CPBP family intramembrane glutamic endopeptidase [Mariniluteicoccus flavus]
MTEASPPAQTTSADQNHAPARPRTPVVRWRPTRLTGLAFLTIGLMWVAYAGSTRIPDPTASWGVFAGLGCLVTATVIPALAVRRHGGLAALGIGRHRWRLALGVAVVLAVGSLPQAIKLAAAAGAPLTTQLVFNALVFWEPLFVFGWLQLRFREAFGHLPAVLLTGLAFGVYHLGAVPVETALGFAAFGLVFAIVFTLVPNLLVLWPITWAVASTIGTLQAGSRFGWTEVVLSAVVVAVQVAILWGVLGRVRRPAH